MESQSMCGKNYFHVREIHGLSMHSNNILHRDIKSDNIMINNKLEIKLGDFSLSKKLI